MVTLWSILKYLMATVRHAKTPTFSPLFEPEIACNLRIQIEAWSGAKGRIQRGNQEAGNHLKQPFQTYTAGEVMQLQPARRTEESQRQNAVHQCSPPVRQAKKPQSANAIRTS